MIINEIPIRSKSSSDSPRPWYEHDITSEGIRPHTANQKGQDRSSNSRIQISYEVTQAHADSLAHEATWIYGVDLEGTYFFLPGSTTDGTGEVPAEIDAHLGFYYPSEDRLDLLVFVEEE